MRALPPKHDGSSSRFAGVSWDRNRRKWRATLNMDGGTVLDQRFDSEVEAARARDDSVREHYKSELRRLNFPRGGEKGIRNG